MQGKGDGWKPLKILTLLCSIIKEKANAVVDALSRKTQCVLSELVVSEWKMYDYINEFNSCFDVRDSGACFCTLVAQLIIL